MREMTGAILITHTTIPAAISTKRMPMPRMIKEAFSRFQNHGSRFGDMVAPRCSELGPAELLVTPLGGKAAVSQVQGGNSRPPSCLRLPQFHQFCPR